MIIKCKACGTPKEHDCFSPSQVQRQPNGAVCLDCVKQRARRRAVADAPDAIERELRIEWWINHGVNCTPYGDDGEQQCCGHDFRREPLDTLRKFVQTSRELRVLNAREREQERLERSIALVHRQHNELVEAIATAVKDSPAVARYIRERFTVPGA